MNFLNASASRKILFPLLYFTILTGWITWPLVNHLRSAVVGWPGDNLYYVWLIGWFQKALFTLHINPFIVPFHNYPDGWPLAYTETTLANILVALPFSLLGGATFGYNITNLLSYILSGWFVYLWSDALFHNKMAAVLAGTIFAFAPYRLAHAMGHLPLMGTQWLVLFFFGLTMVLNKRIWEWKAVLSTGIGLGMMSLSSMYYLYMGVMVSAMVFIGFMVFINRQVLFERLFWKKVAAVGIIALPLLAAALIPYLLLADQGAANHRTIESVDLWSASITDFLLPSPSHFLWGNWVTEHINRPLWVEQYIYLGVIPILMMVAAIFPVKRIERERKQQIGWFVFIMLSSIILAMGTTLHWLGEPVLVSLPEFLKKSYVLSQGLIPLPNYFLFKYLPFYNGMRSWSRYGVYVILFGAILAGIGFARISTKMQHRMLQVSALILSILLIGVDYRINVPLAFTQPRPVDLWLKSAPASGSVAQFPIMQSASPESVLGSLTHDKPLFGMFYGAYFPKEFEALLPALDAFPAEECIRILQQRKVSYVIVDASFYKDWTKEQVAAPAPELSLQQKVDQYLIYRLGPP